MFGPLSEASSYPVVMYICSTLSLCGALVSYFFIDDDSKDGLLDEYLPPLDEPPPQVA